MSAQCFHASLVPIALAKAALPLECSHLSMDAVISLGSEKFHSLIWTFGCIIHTEQIAHILCLQILSVSLMHYPTSDSERLKIYFE